MNIAVIGLGSMGKRRIRIIKALYPESKIVGVDTRDDRRLEVKQKYEISSYTSLDEAQMHLDIKCVFVCTSPLSHAGIIMDCLKRDLNVFTEINLVPDHYEEMQLIAQKKQLVLFLSSTPIYRSEMCKITEMVHKEEKVSYIYHVGQYLPDWHPWEDINSFFVHDKRTGGCREIFAIELPWMNKAFGPVTEFHSIHTKMTNLKLDYDDCYTVQLIHQNGTIGTMIVDVVCRQAVRHLEVYNENIYIKWDGNPESLLMRNPESGEMKQIDTSMYENIAGYSEFINEKAYVNEILEFFEVLNGKKAEYGFAEDKEILQLVDKL